MVGGQHSGISKEPVSLFIVSTPLQLISCSEARRYFSPKHSLLIVARPSNASTEQHMRNMLAALGWQDSEVIFLGRRLSYLSLAWRLHRLRRLLLNGLYIGNKGSWVHEVFVRSLPTDQVVYLDDGMATITDYYNLCEGKSESPINRRQLRWLGYLGIRLTDVLPKPHYFTIFPLSACPEVAITYNDLSLFKCAFPPRSGGSLSDVVAFVGQPLTNDPEYLKSVRRQLTILQTRHANYRIVYYMHRKENRQTLTKAFAGCNVDIILPDMPLEVEMARAEHRPVALYSLISTALFTLKAIIPEVSVFYIPDENLARRVRYYKEIIEIMEKIGVQRAELSDALATQEEIKV